MTVSTLALTDGTVLGFDPGTYETWRAEVGARVALALAVVTYSSSSADSPGPKSGPS